MKFINKETKTYSVFKFLYEGNSITPTEAAQRFNVKNLRAEVSRIRQNGYAVYAKSRPTTEGKSITEYVMGKPSREIVALGYKAKSMGITL